MKTLIDYYDDHANAWAEKWYADNTLLPYLQSFVKLLPQNARVLDLCCGAGYESMRLSKLGVNVIGADLSKQSIALAREKNPTIDFFVKDMLKSYRDLGLFDGLVCIAGLVHLPEEKLAVAFENMHDVLKTNAPLLIVVKNGDKIIKSITVDNTEYAREFYCYTLDKIKQHSKQYFELLEELPSSDDWRYYILRKIKR